MKFIKKMGVYFIGTVLSKIITFLLIPIYTHELLPSDYGESDLAYTTVVMLVSIVFMELWATLLRFSYDVKTEAGRKKLLGGIVLLAVIFTPLYIAVCAGLTFWLNMPYCGLMILYGILFMILLLYQYAARGEGDSRDFVISGAITAAVQLGVVLLLIYVFGMGAEVVLIAPSAGCAAAIIYLEARHKYLRLINLKLAERKELKLIIAYSFPLAINSAAYNAIINFNRFIAKSRLSDADNGYIALSAKFMLMVSSLVYIYALAWQESAYEQSGSEGRGKYYSGMFSIFTDGSGLVLGTFITFTSIVFPYFIGNEYAPAQELLPLYYISSFFYALSTFHGHIYSAEKRTGILLYSTIAGALCNVIFLYAFIGRIGVISVPISLVLGYAVNYAVREALLGKIIKMHAHPFKIAVNIIFVSVCAASVYLSWDIRIKALLPAVYALYLAYLYRDKLKGLSGLLKKR